MFCLTSDCRYVKFDTFHPAVDRGLPVTRVISRVVLQQLLAETAQKMAGDDSILNDQNVVDYEHVVGLPLLFTSHHPSLHLALESKMCAIVVLYTGSCHQPPVCEAACIVLRKSKARADCLLLTQACIQTFAEALFS